MKCWSLLNNFRNFVCCLIYYSDYVLSWSLFCSALAYALLPFTLLPFCITIYKVHLTFSAVFRRRIWGLWLTICGRMKMSLWLAYGDAQWAPWLGSFSFNLTNWMSLNQSFPISIHTLGCSNSILQCIWILFLPLMMSLPAALCMELVDTYRFRLPKFTVSEFYFWM